MGARAWGREQGLWRRPCSLGPQSRCEAEAERPRKHYGGGQGTPVPELERGDHGLLVSKSKCNFFLEKAAS